MSNSSDSYGSDVSESAQSPVDAELVGRTLTGDAEAFAQLVQRYQRQANAIAYRLLNHRDDAMEVVQDAFLRGYDRLASLDKPERFGPWLLRIVNNTALNRRRRRALRKHPSLDTAADDDGPSLGARQIDPRAETPLELAVGSDLRDRLRQAIDELPELQRQALVLFSIEKMPQKQVAEVMETSVEAVKWHVFTARKILKEQCKDMLEEK